MMETNPTPKERDHTRAILIASTIVIVTCILSCATVLVILIMRVT
jgi:hypothetical protein